ATTGPSAHRSWTTSPTLRSASFSPPTPPRTRGSPDPNGPLRAAPRGEAASARQLTTAADGRDTSETSARTPGTAAAGRILHAAEARCGSFGVIARGGS